MNYIPRTKNVFRRGSLAILVLVIAACVLSSCNYRLSSSLDGAPTRTIFMTTVENQLYPPRAGLEYDLTRRLKDEIAVDRRLRLVDGTSDIQLKVSLVGFDEPTIVKILETGLPAEILIRATVVLEATGYGVETGRLSRRISVSDSYAPALGETRTTGLERLWRDLSREIIDAVTDTEWARPGPK